MRAILLDIFSSYFQVALFTEKSEHSWKKPNSLMEKLIRIYSNVDQTILDPYAWSGSTIISAKECGRKALGCDIDPK